MSKIGLGRSLDKNGGVQYSPLIPKWLTKHWIAGYGVNHTAGVLNTWTDQIQGDVFGNYFASTPVYEVGGDYGRDTIWIGAHSKVIAAGGTVGKIAALTNLSYGSYTPIVTPCVIFYVTDYNEFTGGNTWLANDSNLRIRGTTGGALAKSFCDGATTLPVRVAGGLSWLIAVWRGDTLQQEIWTKAGGSLGTVVLNSTSREGVKNNGLSWIGRYSGLSLSNIGKGGICDMGIASNYNPSAGDINALINYLESIT